MDHKDEISLPPGWAHTTISDVTAPVENIDPADDPERQIAYIDIGSIDNVRNVVATAKRFMLRDAPSRARQIVRTDDILFATVRPYLRNIARVPETYNEQIASTGFSVLRAVDGVNPKFLFYKAISAEFVNALSVKQYGVSYPAVTDEQVRGQPLLLPPTGEQARIVEKIEALLSEVDKGVETCRTSYARLAAYRYAILRRAFEGKLTAQWREENPEKLAGPAFLADMRHIREEQGQELALIPADLASKLPSLPNGFVYTLLANLGDLGRGKSKHRPRNDPKLFGGPYPFVQTGDVKAAERTIRNYSQTYNETGLAQSKLWPKGTLCITIAANIAETAFLGMDACFPDSVVGFTADRELVLPEYIELFIKSARARIEAYAPATAQKNINLTTLENLVVPLCSIAEQRALIDRLEVILSAVGGAEAEIQFALKRSDVLRESILDKAFSGLLVAQSPADEPASVLLDRIRPNAGKPNNFKKNGKRRAA